MNAHGLTIVGASAGSGKTYRLTKDAIAAIDPAGEHPIAVEGLLAVTYTKKGHAELAGRIREKLVAAGAFDEAMRLPLAYVGTVHATCLRLLQEFALDAGLSPSVDVVAEDQGALLRQALESALSMDQHKALDDLSARFRLRWNGRIRRHDWLGPVSDIMELARGNRIAPEALPAMAERSAAGLLRLFPAPAKDGPALDKALVKELASTTTALTSRDDGTAVTRIAIELLGEAKKELDGQGRWFVWAELSTIKTSVSCASAVTKLREVAASYETHPRLHTDLRALIFAIFEAARIGLRAYQDWKAQRHVVDYVDMLDGALRLLDHPRVRDELGSRLRLAVIDEFQDTSPIQLALFVKLHELAKRSIWVGDRKQCIFEYAGADPTLMDAVARWVTSSGGTRDALRQNYRSRPELVHACSALFVSALARHDFQRDEVEVAPARPAPQALDHLPPFGLWCLDAGNKLKDAEAIASGVQRLLQNPHATPVVDRATTAVRPLRPGDIAILVATNAETSAVAGALHARGIRVAVARAGLLGTPEGTLADAALRWLLDEDDSLAAAVLDAITGYGGQDSDTWLAARLHDPAGPTSVWRDALGHVRGALGVLSPSEALDEVFAALDAVHLAARWPDPAQRVANLDALRALALHYEDRCAQEREAGTVAGLLRHFDAMRTETLRRDEVLASDDQHVPSDDGAVIVCTYHKAKGLEWPVVVLASLDRGERRNAFEVCPETDCATFNPEEPLAKRWIRYWPWPFSPIKNLPLLTAAEASDEGKRIALREDKERVRLLYVGFTRARDHLVLAVRVAKGKPKTEWLDTLSTERGDPLLELPIDAPDGADDVVRIHADSGQGTAMPARVWRLGSVAAASVAAPPEVHRWFKRPAAPTSDPLRYRITPSNAREDWPELAMPKLGELVPLPAGMPIDAKTAAYDVLGDAVHGFLAADGDGLASIERHARAHRLIVAAGLIGIVRPERLVEAADRLRVFVEARWPGATWHREIPIEAMIASPRGARRVSGTIDLLLETRDGYVIIDHKTFPGTTEAAWRAKTVEFLPQLAAYAEALRRVAGKGVIGCWVHLPVGGGMVEVIA
ncbi:MAG TPA: UvrD-helicase domain-containing protein [Polyangiaceae bacterium]|nr:UvrD-helicase domain-containing protein [Polyangiaceae bacterium]